MFSLHFDIFVGRKMTTFLTFLVNGALIGLLYSLIALTFIIIYRSSRVFNLAQGELIVIAAFLIWSFSDWLPDNPFIAVLLATLALVVIGLIIERMVIGPLIGADVFSYVMVTIGLLLFLQGVVLVLWGPEIRLFPAIVDLAGVRIGGMVLDRALVYGAIATVVIATGMMIFFNRTQTGLEMTAVAEGHEIALSMGISIKKSLAISWVLSCILSIVAAIMFLNGKGLSFAAADVALVALPAVLLAGLESVGGVLIAGLIIGITAQLGSYWLDPLVGGGVADVLPFVFMIIILLIRPAGLFGWKSVDRL